MKKDGIWVILGTPYIKGHKASIADHYHIPYNTLDYWCKQLSKNKNWLPLHKKNPLKSRVFTPKQEKTLNNIVKNLCKELKLPMTNNLFRFIATMYYHKIPKGHHPQPNLQFNCSDHFILKFRDRFRLSRRKAHAKRRPKVSQDEIKEFREKAKEIFTNFSHDHIVNCDETFWHVTNMQLTSWVERNEDSVQIDPRGDDKKGFTALATILLSGRKLPLVFIAKGKQIAEGKWFGYKRHITDANINFTPLPNPLYKRYTGSLGNNEFYIPQSRTDFSASGWTCETTWENYLHFLRREIPPIYNDEIRDKIFLFADSFPAHHSEHAKMVARSLNIELIKIPEGTTDECQPLDCRIFGALKAQARAYSNANLTRFVFDNFDALTGNQNSETLNMDIPKIDRATSSSIFDVLWENVREDQIISAWEKAFLTEEERQDIRMKKMSFNYEEEAVFEEEEDVDDEGINENDIDFDRDTVIFHD